MGAVGNSYREFSGRAAAAGGNEIFDQNLVKNVAGIVVPMNTGAKCTCVSAAACRCPQEMISLLFVCICGGGGGGGGAGGPNITNGPC